MSKLPDFEGFAMFAKVAEEGSFAAAAATMGVSVAALFGRVRLYSLRTQLCIFDGNRPPKRIPQANDVRDDHALAFLGRDFLRQQGRADASLDTGDLRLNQGAQPISIFLVKRLNAAFFP